MLIEETVWLGDIPVATLRPNGVTVSIYYVHSDQLNSPRQVTRPSDNVKATQKARTRYGFPLSFGVLERPSLETRLYPRLQKLTARPWAS